MVELVGKVELQGNFFRTQHPGNTVYQNMRLMLEEVAAELETAAKGDIAARAGSMPNWTGWTRDHTEGYVTSAKTGKHWATYAAVGIPTVGMDASRARRTKAAAASIERRFHPFRRVKSAAYRLRAITNANLAKGLE